MANKEEPLTEERKQEILVYCNENPHHRWDQIAAHFGLPEKTVCDLYISSLYRTGGPGRC